MAFRNLTNSGKEYLATRLANELPVKFIKAKIGNGSVPLLTNPANTTDLYNFKKQVTILNAVQEQNSIKLTLQITNDGINEGFYLKEIGIYVDDNGKEVLYWYCNEDNSQYINAQSDIPIVFEIDIMMEVTNINSTIVEWTGKDTWISKTHFDEKVRTFEIPTIAELQSRKNLKVGDIVEVLGYYTAGDGANHKRIIANEDDGTGIQLNNGLWANILEKNIVHTSWFGTKENEDSTQAVQKALNILPDTKSTIIVDKPTIVGVINVKPYKTLTGNKLKAEQISMYQSSSLINIELEPNNSLNNKPMILIDAINCPKTKCDVLIDKIKVYGKTQNRDFLLLRNVNEKTSGSQGIYSLKVSDIYGSVQFNTIVKFQCAKLKANPNRSWITYCILKNIRWASYKKAIELLTFDSDGVEGEYGYDTTARPVSTIEAITIDNCTFESIPTSETFCRLGNGCNNISIINSWSGDFHVSNTKKYYIFDTRGNYHLTDLTLYYLDKSWIYSNEYLTFLGTDIELAKTSEINFHYKKSSYSELKSHNNFSLNHANNPGEIYIIAKIPKNIEEFSTIPYILSQAQFNNLSILNIPTINLVCNSRSSLNEKSKIEFTTNIETLKKLIIFKDKSENLYVGIESTENNFMGCVSGKIKCYSNEEYSYYKTYIDRQSAINSGLIFVEEILANQRIPMSDKVLSYSFEMPADKTGTKNSATIVLPKKLNTTNYYVEVHKTLGSPLDIKFNVESKAIDRFLLHWISEQSLAGYVFEIAIIPYSEGRIKVI